MTPKDIEVVEAGLKTIVTSIGRLVAKDKDGRVIDSGSFFFIELDGEKLLATAHHVVSGLFDKGNVYIHIFNQKELNIELPSPPIEFYIAKENVIQVHNGEFFDIAAVRPPFNTNEYADIKWFAIDRHAEKFRRHLKPMIEQERNPRLMAVVLGFPRFSRFEYSGQRVQVSGLIPIWAILERVSEPPPILPGHVPQVIFEIDYLEEKELPVDAPEFARKSFQQFQSMSLDNKINVLGGYSGGPLIYFCEQGVFLVGIMKQGGLVIGGQGFATPIDAFVENIRYTPNWQRGKA